MARIVRILEEEIRPAVAMDGGDIVFAGFRDGVVELYMHGSCSGCPSSTATLKHGIETRLREEIPEIQGVVALVATRAASPEAARTTNMRTKRAA